MIFRRKNKLTKDEEYNNFILHIRRSIIARQGMEAKWRRWYNIVDDSLWGSGKLNDGYRPGQVNQLSAILENVIPTIAFRAGKVEIRSFSVEDMTSAAIWEKVGRNIVIKNDFVNQIQMAAYNALVLGDGLMKIGYDTLPLLSEPQWNAGLSSERGARQVSVYGMEWPMFEFFPDYSVDRWNRQRFFHHELYKHIDEVKGNPIFDNAQVKKITPTIRTDDMFYTSDPEHIDKKKDYVAIQEFHDLVNGEVLIFADKSGTDSYLYRGPEPFNMIPVERLSFFPRPMSVWGKGITQTIEKHLVDLSKIDTYAMATLRKEALLKIALDAGRWTKANRAKLENSQDSIIDLAGDPAGSYEIMQFGSASKEFVFERTRAIKMATIRELAGSGRMQQGLHEVGVGSATEAATLQNNADVINQWRSNKLAEFAARVLEKMIFIVSVTYSPERIAKMVGYPAESIAPFLQPYDPSKYVLKYGQAALADQQERQQKFMMFVQMFGQSLNPALVAQIAADIFDLEYTDELLIPGTPMGGAPGQLGQGGQQATTGFRPAESQEQTGG